MGIPNLSDFAVTRIVKAELDNGCVAENERIPNAANHIANYREEIESQPPAKPEPRGDARELWAMLCNGKPNTKDWHHIGDSLTNDEAIAIIEAHDAALLASSQGQGEPDISALREAYQKGMAHMQANFPSVLHDMRQKAANLAVNWLISSDLYFMPDEEEQRDEDIQYLRKEVEEGDYISTFSGEGKTKWDAFESGYAQGHNDTVESCVRDPEEAAVDYFSEAHPQPDRAREALVKAATQARDTMLYYFEIGGRNSSDLGVAIRKLSAALAQAGTKQTGGTDGL